MTDNKQDRPRDGVPFVEPWPYPKPEWIEIQLRGQPLEIEEPEPGKFVIKTTVDGTEYRIQLDGNQMIQIGGCVRIEG